MKEAHHQLQSNACFPPASTQLDILLYSVSVILEYKEHHLNVCGMVPARWPESPVM